MTDPPSQLPAEVADSESLSRFLTQRNHYNRQGPKASAFLPNPKTKNTSVFRIGRDDAAVRQAWDNNASGERSLRGYAVVVAGDVRSLELEVEADDIPPGHANIENWPWFDDDPALQKAKQKELAMGIASEATLVVF